MSALRANEPGTESAQYHLRMMLALLIDCYANGIFGSSGRPAGTWVFAMVGGLPPGSRHDLCVSAAAIEAVPEAAFLPPW